MRMGDKFARWNSVSVQGAVSGLQFGCISQLRRAHEFFPMTFSPSYCVLLCVKSSIRKKIRYPELTPAFV